MYFILGKDELRCNFSSLQDDASDIQRFPTKHVANVTRGMAPETCTLPSGLCCG